MAYVWIDVVVLKLISSVGHNFQRRSGGEIWFSSIDVEAVSGGSKPPAAVGVRISMGERHDFVASVPLSTRASSLHIIPRRESWRLFVHHRQREG